MEDDVTQEGLLFQAGSTIETESPEFQGGLTLAIQTSEVARLLVPMPAGSIRPKNSRTGVKTTTM